MRYNTAVKFTHISEYTFSGIVRNFSTGREIPIQGNLSDPIFFEDATIEFSKSTNSDPFPTNPFAIGGSIECHCGLWCSCVKEGEWYFRIRIMRPEKIVLDGKKLDVDSRKRFDIDGDGEIRIFDVETSETLVEGALWKFF